MNIRKQLKRSLANEKKKLRLGDIYLIPLPNGKFTFGRLFKESTLAIYKGTYDKVKLTCRASVKIASHRYKIVVVC